MKVLVCISQVPDTTTKVKFIDGNKKLRYYWYSVDN